MSDSAKYLKQRRLLRALAKHSEIEVKFRELAGIVTMIAGTRSIDTDKEVFFNCHDKGYTHIDGPIIAITSKGQNRLRSLLHPDPGSSLPISGASKEKKNTKQAEFNCSESPLSRLYQLRQKDGSRYLTSVQLNAGERLRADFEQSQLQPSVTQNWDSLPNGRRGRINGSSSTDLSDFALDKRECVFSALDSLAPDLAGVAMDACCFLKGLELIERERAWPPRSAKLMLRTALGGLAKYYRMEPRPQPSAAHIKHWGQAGYRPELSISNKQE